MRSVVRNNILCRPSPWTREAYRGFKYPVKVFAQPFSATRVPFGHQDPSCDVKDESFVRDTISGTNISNVKLAQTNEKDKQSRYKDMLILVTVSGVHRVRARAIERGRQVALVPTMGALHEGHLALVRKAAQYSDEIIVSVFVNPTQFSANEDLSTYPQPWKEDQEKLATLNEELRIRGSRGRVVAIFKPTTEVMYPGSGDSLRSSKMSYVIVDPSMTGVLEGAARPDFFRGVTTVCMKLFNLVQPDAVFFGQKDIQQVAVIKRMVRDFHCSTSVWVVPTVRDKTGLALSSRNVYLGRRRKDVARVLRKALRAAELAYRKDGIKDRKAVIDVALRVAASIQNEQHVLPASLRANFTVDYISLTDFDTMEEVESINPAKTTVISAAVVMLPLEDIQDGEELGLGGDTKPVRLLDNILLRPPRNSTLRPVKAALSADREKSTDSVDNAASVSDT